MPLIPASGNPGAVASKTLVRSKTGDDGALGADGMVRAMTSQGQAETGRLWESVRRLPARVGAP